MVVAKHHHIDVRVNDRQRAYVREKARGYGITMTELMLRGVEAYTRVFDADAGKADLVAVNYGVWLHAMRGLLDVRQAMRDCVRQLAGIRRLHAGLAGRGGAGRDDLARVEAMLGASTSEVHDALRRVGRALDALESLQGAACVTDFCLGVEPGAGASLVREG